MVEDITLTKARKIARTWTRQFVENLNVMNNPSIHRYMMLDGQRLVLAQCENTSPLLFADSHASFDDDLWLKQFPEEVWQ